jgi:hypothetical protein
LLPLALLRLRNTPGKQDLNLFQSVYERLFLTNDLLLNPEAAQLVFHVTQLAKFQKMLSKIKQSIHRQSMQGPPLFCPRDLVLIKSSARVEA